MNLKDMGKVQKMTFSAMIMALYVVLVYITQSFSFGAYQIRIATSVYALAYLFPFLVLPLGLANSISNTLFGGLGLLDTIGGGIAGILTTSRFYSNTAYICTGASCAFMVILYSQGAICGACCQSLYRTDNTCAVRYGSCVCAGARMGHRHWTRRTK